MSRVAYQYVVLRCVPRPDREEFVNVGVVLYCEAEGFLDVAGQVDEERLRGLDPRLDLGQVRTGLAYAAAVCGGDPVRVPRPRRRSGSGSASSRRPAAPCSSRGRCTAG